VDDNFRERNPLLQWERIEVRGFTLIPAFTLDGGRGCCHSLPKTVVQSAGTVRPKKKIKYGRWSITTVPRVPAGNGLYSHAHSW
jgi:hypothetical protein